MVEVVPVPAAVGLGRPLAVGSFTPAMVVGALLLVCCVKGLWATVGVEVPPDPDTVRDLGFIQGFLDGNWFGDPAIAGAWRWYPPLLHGVAALVIGGLHLPLFSTWLHAGALLNLLSPLSFYLMNRRLIGVWPAAAATAVFVLYDSVVMPGDAGAGYTPWTLTPALSWPLFFGSIWLIAGRVAALRLMDAVVLGTVFGLVFLAHTVPAVLLSGITGASALAIHGWRWRPLRWLAVIAAIEIVWSGPFLLPLVVAYRLHIVNPGPGSWVHPVLSDPTTLLPNFLGLLALAWLVFRREWLRLPAVTVVIIEAWIGLCVGLLGRHYGCAVLEQTSGACGVFVVAVHHYHVYLQAAWASLIGLAVVRIWVLRRWGVIPLSVLAVVVGLIGFFGKAEDLEFRRLGSTGAALVLNRAAYDWILARTRAGDLFVTDLPPGGVDMGPEAATVIAAGRRLVAPPEFHTNPFVAWAPMNARRVGYLGGDLCGLLREAGGSDAYFLLPNGQTGPGGAAVFRDGFDTIYRVDRGSCATASR